MYLLLILYDPPLREINLLCFTANISATAEIHPQLYGPLMIPLSPTDPSEFTSFDCSCSKDCHSHVRACLVTPSYSTCFIDAPETGKNLTSVG